VVLAGFAAFLSLYAVQPMLPLFQTIFDASHFEVSLTVTATTAAVAVSAPLIGRVADAWGKRRVIVAAAFALGATTLLASTAGSLKQLIGWRFLQGLATPGVFAVTVAYIHDRWDPARAGSATAAYVSGTVVGGFVGRATAGVVASLYGWRASFAAIGAMSLACAVLLWSGLQEDRPTAREPEAVSAERSSLAAHLASRELTGAYAAGFCVLFTQIAMFTYVTFHLADPPFRLSTAALGWLFAVYLAGATITPFSGRLIDEHGHRAGLIAAMAIGIAGSLLTLASMVTLVVIGLALVSSGVFIAQAAANSYVGASATRDRGLAVGLYAMFYYVGGSVGGALPALFWSRGGWPACVALVVFVQLATAAIGLLAWKSPPTP
jgi:predicted MFS family arabinose efflux permease